MIRAILRRLMLWCWPELADVRPLTRFAAASADDIDGVRRVATNQSKTIADWAAYCKQLGVLLMQHERDLARLRAALAPGTEHRGLSARIARVELMVLPELYDTPVNAEAVAEMAERVVALGGSGGEKS